jgi:hypothetical protein
MEISENASMVVWYKFLLVILCVASRAGHKTRHPFEPVKVNADFQQDFTLFPLCQMRAVL